LSWSRSTCGGCFHSADFDTRIVAGRFLTSSRRNDGRFRRRPAAALRRQVAVHSSPHTAVCRVAAKDTRLLSVGRRARLESPFPRQNNHGPLSSVTWHCGAEWLPFHQDRNDNPTRGGESPSTSTARAFGVTVWNSSRWRGQHCCYVCDIVFIFSTLLSRMSVCAPG
jgi:hypothetical protein